MNIKFDSELVFDIYIKKFLTNGVNFSLKEDIEKYIKKLFKILKEKYELYIEGFYNIIVYVDKYYGIVLHLEKEKLDYCDYYKNQVDMRLIVVDSNFMYKVDDIPEYLFNKVNIITKCNQIYLTLKEELTEVEMMNLLENCKIVINL